MLIFLSSLIVLLYFNSIKVRLEHLGQIPPLPHPYNFNSIKVRLELNIPLIAEIFAMNFNSIKVRLELCSVIGEGSTAKFQFHKGAIRTVINLAIEYCIDQFQFHKGAIRTHAAIQVEEVKGISIP